MMKFLKPILIASVFVLSSLGVAQAKEATSVFWPDDDVGRAEAVGI